MNTGAANKLDDVELCLELDNELPVLLGAVDVSAQRSEGMDNGHIVSEVSLERVDRHAGHHRNDLVRVVDWRMSVSTTRTG